MTSWTIYSLSLLAIFVIGGRAFPLPTFNPTEESPPKNTSYNYYAETFLGSYTGPWMADTLSCFDRALAVIEHDSHRNEQRLVNFAVDKMPSDSGHYRYRVEYARDPRTLKTHSLNTSNGRVYYLNANDCAESGDYHNGTYPLNKEAIWQISIPEDHVAYVVFTNVNLEREQSGNCINDYISMYDDSNTPTKFCSSLEMDNMLYKHEGAERLTIKFQSNEAINEGGFSGAVWLPHETILQRSRRDVSFAETVETVSVAEEEHINEDEIEQAIECLVDIAKHGEAAAAKYTEEAPNEECKKMAEAFFMQG